MKLKDKIAIITGGASGIGESGTRVFASEGATVCIFDVNETAGKNLEKELSSNGQKVVFFKTDISSYESVEASVSAVEKLFGRIDVLYNNASVFLGGKDTVISDVDLDIWDKVLSINLNGMFYMCKQCLPIMKRSGGGSVINTASSAGVVGIPGCAAYTATKGATVTLTRSMAVDYGKYNIRTNCIAPAAIETHMVKESNLNDPDFDNEFFKHQITPLRRWGKPDEIAHLAAFLASDEAAYINGVIIPCDGGITINGNVNKEKY
ncbi:MAG: SDR family oxidoreductase [Ruminococcaceae bacterium]|nr:SDR family oxidoreductase [Oscillospiraceae bacterium]